MKRKRKKEGFTPRNSEVFDTACRLFVEGTAKTEIAKTLDVSPNTVFNWAKKDAWKRKVEEYQKKLPPKMPPLRTRKIKEFHQAWQLAATTKLTLEEIAATVGVTVTTLTGWREEPEWEVNVNAYTADWEHRPRPADDQEIDKITPQFLSTLDLRNLKNLCMVLKRNIEYQREIQVLQMAEAESALDDSEIIQKLEEFCARDDISAKHLSATHLRSQWAERLKPRDDKPDE